MTLGLLKLASILGLCAAAPIRGESSNDSPKVSLYYLQDATAGYKYKGEDIKANVRKYHDSFKAEFGKDYFTFGVGHFTTDPLTLPNINGYGHPYADLYLYRHAKQHEWSEDMTLGNDWTNLNLDAAVTLAEYQNCWSEVSGGFKAMTMALKNLHWDKDSKPVITLVTDHPTKALGLAKGIDAWNYPKTKDDRPAVVVERQENFDMSTLKKENQEKKDGLDLHYLPHVDDFAKAAKELNAKIVFVTHDPLYDESSKVFDQGKSDYENALNGYFSAKYTNNWYNQFVKQLIDLGVYAKHVYQGQGVQTNDNDMDKILKFVTNDSGDISADTDPSDSYDPHAPPSTIPTEKSKKGLWIGLGVTAVVALLGSGGAYFYFFR